MNQHRPTVAAVVTGLVGSLLAWAIATLPASVPADVTGWLGAAAILIAGIIGAAAGKVAERHTWAEDSHVAAVAYAFSLDPDEWDDELRKAGLPSHEEAKRRIGTLPYPRDAR